MGTSLSWIISLESKKTQSSTKCRKPIGLRTTSPEEECGGLLHCGKGGDKPSVLQGSLSWFSKSRWWGDHTTLEVCCPPLSPSQVHSSEASLTHASTWLIQSEALPIARRSDVMNTKTFFFPFSPTSCVLASLFPEFTRSQLPGNFTSAVFFFSFCFSDHKVYLGSRLEPIVLL